MSHVDKPITITQMKRIVTMRNNKIHLSTVMLIQIVHHLVTTSKSAYLGEISAYYLEVSRKADSAICYTESGIRAHLRSMEEKGYISIKRDGLYNNYSVTLKGLMSVRGLV